MNALGRWNQLKELEALRRGYAALAAGSARWPDGSREPMAAAEWGPPVDISETDHEFLIQVELPGVKREAIKVTAQAGTLVITGERCFDKAEPGRKYHRVERCYGQFTRQFSLPEEASPAKVSAEFHEGVLSVHLVKTIKSAPLQVEVKVD